jgi:ABC-type branched-subunit amino acid transport system ATPase component
VRGIDVRTIEHRIGGAETTGASEVAGEPVRFSSPREALDRGIATVYQDLAVVPLMPVWRNFFLGNEVRRKGFRMDIGFMRRTAKKELLDMGIDLRDVEQPIGTLSGGERQCVAISRAVYFGAKVLTALMAGGSELEELSHELDRGGSVSAAAAKILEEEAHELGITSEEKT